MSSILLLRPLPVVLAVQPEARQCPHLADVSVAVDAPAAGAQDGDDNQETSRVLFELI